MTDRELLEKAAKAAGVAWNPRERIGIVPSGLHPSGWRIWNPLTDDGDALRLAVVARVHLRFCLIGTVPSVRAASIVDDSIEPLGDDPNAATRRAIVRAAAAIGEQYE